MTIIALVNQKGGCAKSTTAVHFAVWLQQQGHSVTVIDADAQRSSSICLDAISDIDIPTHVIQTPDELLEQTPDIAAGADYCVIDGAAGLSESTRAILFRCDLAVIPCQPTGVDLRSAADAIRLVRQAQSVRGGQPNAVVFLSRAVKGTKLKDEALSLLGKSGVLILTATIHQRQVVADTFGQQATVFELSGRSARDSAREFENLFTEVLEVATDA